jgi:hypothetical protein
MPPPRKNPVEPLDPAVVELLSAGDMTVKQIMAEFSCLSEQRVWALMNAGELPYFVVDGRGTRRIPRKAVIELVARLYQRYQESK